MSRRRILLSTGKIYVERRRILRDSLPLSTAGSCLMGGVPCGYFHAAPPPTRSHYCPDTKTPRSLYHSSRRENNPLHIFTGARGGREKGGKIISLLFLLARARLERREKRAIPRDNSSWRINDVVYRLLRGACTERYKIIFIATAIKGFFAPSALRGSSLHFSDVFPPRAERMRDTLNLARPEYSIIRYLIKNPSRVSSLPLVPPCSSFAVHPRSYFRY